MKRRRKENNRKTKVLFTKTLKLLLTIFVIVFSVGFIKNSKISVNEYHVFVNDKNLNGLKIVQFSDVFYGKTLNNKKFKKAIKKINYLKPDIIIFNGSLLKGDETLNKKELVTTLKKIDSNIGKYFFLEKDESKQAKKIMKDGLFKDLSESDEIYLKNSLIEITSKGPKNDMASLIIEVNNDSSLPNSIIFLKGKPSFNFKHHIKNSTTNKFISSGINGQNFSFKLINRPSINFIRIRS